MSSDTASFETLSVPTPTTQAPDSTTAAGGRTSHLWRQIDRLAPRAAIAPLLLAHLARWTLVIGVGFVSAVMFGGLRAGPGSLAGAVLTNVLLLGICGLTLALFRPTLYRSLRSVTVVAGIFLVVLGVAAVAARGAASPAEFVPIALAAVLLSVLFDPRVSVFATLVLGTLVGVQPAYLGTPTFFLLVVAGVAASFSVRIIKRRDQVYYSILVTASAYALAETALALSSAASWDKLWHAIAWGAANSVVSVALALMLLPPLEEFSGIDTYLKLLEWSDLNRPLLRRLSLEAPGTFAHTMRIANLAEAAADAIGANGLRARVGAYYHDIGKLKRPDYFVENQPRGRNPHDKLKPVTSAAIIRNHVREGLEMAEESGLPTALRPFITEHHGTGLITYFLEKAKERDGGNINQAEFVYPGPIPQTPETAIVMLADGVEASAHVLNDPTPEKIRDVIAHIVRQRIDQGQLRDAPLTLKQLETVKEQFARVLIGMYHHRIDYPRSSGGVTGEFAPLSSA
jgi:putative nucleotidyltransferase with HDIG domain